MQHFPSHYNNYPVRFSCKHFQQETKKQSGRYDSAPLYLLLVYCKSTKTLSFPKTELKLFELFEFLQTHTFTNCNRILLIILITHKSITRTTTSITVPRHNEFIQKSGISISLKDYTLCLCVILILIHLCLNCHS